MRSMRACATANVIFLGLCAVTAAFSACAVSATPQGPPPDFNPPPTAGASTSTAAATAEAAKPKPAPKSPADCKAMLSDITNEPPANAVALNNAQTSADAGATDRLEPLTELIRSKRDSFRCCFDVWAKDHPGTAGSVKMVLKLKADGTVTSVDFEDTQNRVADVEPCIGEMAKSLPYPRSPSGKETKFRYPFDFKARR
jgi:hypothetical protein